MKVGDRVWCTASAQELYDKGVNDNHSTWLLHSYGQIIGLSRKLTLACVSFAEHCNYEDGYSPVRVWVKREWLKVAELDEDYLADDYDNPNFLTFDIEPEV